MLLLLAAVLAVPTYWWAYRRIPVPDLAYLHRSRLAGRVVRHRLGLGPRSRAISRARPPNRRDTWGRHDPARHVRCTWTTRREGVSGNGSIGGFGLSLALMAVEIGLDYPLLRSFKEADSGREAVWFNRGAVAMALIVWPLTACLWARGLSWKALAIPVLLGIASFFLESVAATLGFVAGVVSVLLVLSHRKAGLAVTIGSKRPGFRRHAVRGHRNARPRVAEGRLAGCIGPTSRGNLEFLGPAHCRETIAGVGVRRIAPHRRAVPGCQRHRPRPDGVTPP